MLNTLKLILSDKDSVSPIFQLGFQKQVNWKRSKYETSFHFKVTNSKKKIKFVMT